jgi:hypothetical protein
MMIVTLVLVEYLFGYLRDRDRDRDGDGDNRSNLYTISRFPPHVRGMSAGFSKVAEAEIGGNSRQTFIVGPQVSAC